MGDLSGADLSEFKWRYFEGEIILWRCAGTAATGSATVILNR